MKRPTAVGLPVLLTISLAACASSTVNQQPEFRSEAAPTASTAATLGVPPGHLPPPGMCRVWLPDTPPGHQPKPDSCDGIVARAPAGSMILDRPGKSRKEVRVRYVDNRRPGVIVLVRVFEATGKLLREERL